MDNYVTALITLSMTAAVGARCISNCIEFDAFKMGVMQILPNTKIRDCIFAAHPVLYYNIGAFAIIPSLNHVCQTDVVIIVQTKDN